MSPTRIVRLCRRHWAKPACFIAFLLVWQAAVTGLGIKVFILPSPAAILSRLVDPAAIAKFKWPTHISATFIEIFLSFLATAAAGMILAIAIAWSNRLAALITPLIVFFNSLPKIALAPLFMVWFGYGVLPNILIAVLVSFFPVVINTVAGLVNIDEDLLDLVRYLNASKFQIFVKIRLPGSLPLVFSGFKISATMCVVGSIVGEFIASERGLGFMLKEAQAFIDTPTMFASLFLISLLGMFFFTAISWLEALAMPWRRREGEET
ncbi:MAG: ABC transporter permease [Planctomycetota bacterium]|jgi:NitT/TauT family transport system permease protein|nr:ABC transporter permease [Planctomycetota bacterium]